MAAVEHPQLHALVRLDVAHHFGADVLEWRPAGGELVLDHPLSEGFGHYRPGVVKAGEPADHLAIAVRGCRNDAVDHGRGEGDVRPHVLAQLGRVQFGQTADDARHRLAVGRKIDAAHHRERRRAVLPAPLDRRHDEARRADRALGLCEVVDDIRVPLVQQPGSGVVAIALFRARQRHAPGRRVRHEVEQPGTLAVGIEDADDRTDHFASGPGGIAHGDGVEPVLRRQRILGVGPPKAGANDRPFRRLAEEVLDVDRHVPAMEGADPQMHDAGSDAGAIVGRLLDARQQVVEVGGIETVHEDCSRRIPRRP